MDALSARCGIVVIGRNETERLERCLTAAGESDLPIVYVDSRSRDDSVAIAERLGVQVVEMAPDAEPSAALARNLGLAEITRLHPSIEYVQFIDGDCILQPGWLDAACEALESDSRLVAVCGYRLEERPARNMYHRAAHLEWQMGPVGEVTDFAGDAMVRIAQLQHVGGYDPRVMAGEDTELSSRLRAEGGRIVRLDHISTTHDIDIATFRQWWRRSQRGGYGATLVAQLHRRGDRLFMDHTRRALLWGGLAPAVAVLALRWSRWPVLLVAGRFALSALRAARSIHPPGASRTDRLAWGMSCSFSAIPGAVGSLRYLVEAARHQHPSLIEYKRGR